MAARPYAAPAADLPPRLAQLDYDAYRDLRFRPAAALWRDLGLPFQVQLFHRGGLFRDRVDMAEAVDGRVMPIAYDPGAFTHGSLDLSGLPPALGFAGFRIHAALNRPDYLDEVAVFLGASYFRALGRGDVYGLSARGLALGAGEANEEFPAFRSFILERPRPGQAFLDVHALLDSPSVAGAYSFRVTPGEVTRFEVAASLFPRRDLDRAGLAPLTSMYLHGAQDPRFDDFRPQVHDSDGLLVAVSGGERIWRPLANPPTLQTSAFLDPRPSAFGLLQRAREFAAYEDLEAHYHRRPGAWIAPLEGFGSGDVRLVEIPSGQETDDNIVASWRPSQALAAGREHRLRYRLSWGAEPAPATGLARVVATRSGRGGGGRRLFVADFASLTPAPDQITARLEGAPGRFSLINIQPNPAVGGVRLSFELDPGPARQGELKAALLVQGRPASEVWVNRWFV